MISRVEEEGEEGKEGKRKEGGKGGGGMEVRRKGRKQGMDGGKEGGRKERDGDGVMRLKVYRNERKKGTRRESLARRGRLRVS